MQPVQYCSVEFHAAAAATSLGVILCKPQANGREAQVSMREINFFEYKRKILMSGPI